MDWQARMNQAIEYLESKMYEDADLSKAAGYSGYTLLDFQRIFSFLTNTTVGMYIRRRRLSLAADDIVSGKEKIIDIALKYGYESPTAFSRAFRQLFGVSPSSARNGRVVLALYPKLNFNNLFEERRINYMNNMEKYSKRGYYITSNMPTYLTTDMDKTSDWFVNVLGWFGGTVARNDKGEGEYGCVYDYPGEIFDILPQRGFYLFQGEPAKGQVGFMSVQGGLENFYNFVKGNGWDKITEPAIQSWGAYACFVITIDGNTLQFQSNEPK